MLGILYFRNVSVRHSVISSLRSARLVICKPAIGLINLNSTSLDLHLVLQNFRAFADHFRNLVKWSTIYITFSKLSDAIRIKTTAKQNLPGPSTAPIYANSWGNNQIKNTTCSACMFTPWYRHYCGTVQQNSDTSRFCVTQYYCFRWQMV